MTYIVTYLYSNIHTTTEHDTFTGEPRTWLEIVKIYKRVLGSRNLMGFFFLSSSFQEWHLWLSRLKVETMGTAEFSKLLGIIIVWWASLLTCLNEELKISNFKIYHY